jgi:hypothetical protein
MPSVSWFEIRKWNGSQSEAFEKLCCQFAHAEAMPDGSRFIPKGRPDSGIECYWILPTGEEWGWQAKFFTDGLNNKRWEQCDKSVKKALDGHLKLSKLIFCIPYEFPDSRLANQISAFQHWENHRTKWAQWSRDRGQTVEFILWGEHELIQRLSKPEHRGRCWFWFNTPAMDAGWLKRNLDAAVLLAGERYTPDLHFDLPLVQYFDALGRTPAFYATLGELGRKLDKAIADVTPCLLSGNAIEEASKQICNSLREALATLNSLTLDLTLPIGFSKLEKTLTSAQEQVQSALYQVWNKRKESDGQPHDDQVFSDYRLREMYSCVGEVSKFCTSPNASLANLPAMLLIGEAGLGKTHLVCSVAEKRIAFGLPTIVLLGQQFDKNEPWSRIIQIVGLSCDRDTFLGALNASGEAAGHRALIMIDAINEGPGIQFWQDHLATMLSHLRNYPHVGIVITIRREYFNKAELPVQQLIPIIHHGFAGVTNEATRHFFQHYGLPTTSSTRESVIILDWPRKAHPSCEMTHWKEAHGRTAFAILTPRCCCKSRRTTDGRRIKRIGGRRTTTMPGHLPGRPSTGCNKPKIFHRPLIFWNSRGRTNRSGWFWTPTQIGDEKKASVIFKDDNSTARKPITFFVPILFEGSTCPQ